MSMFPSIVYTGPEVKVGDEPVPYCHFHRTTRPHTVEGRDTCPWWGATESMVRRCERCRHATLFWTARAPYDAVCRACADRLDAVLLAKAKRLGILPEERRTFT